MCLVFDPFIKEADVNNYGGKKCSFETLIKAADFITIHAPLLPQTRNLIGEKEFKKMKKGVRIINVARGGIINEEALYKVLKGEKGKSAAIDVWEKEPACDNKLLELPNVLVTPHLGSSTKEAQENVALEIAGQIIKALKKGVYQNIVNKNISRK